ncbi:MAG: hypothetical protein IJS88_04210 [Alphaproteobacteria bacterium]|nr:hypothetical protein [Alphaproteobacteria bacterium]
MREKKLITLETLILMKKNEQMLQNGHINKVCAATKINVTDFSTDLKDCDLSDHDFGMIGSVLDNL